MELHDSLILNNPKEQIFNKYVTIAVYLVTSYIVERR